MAVYTTSSITLTDTGKRRVVSGSVEETDLVNSGSAVTLLGVQITLDEGALLNTNPSLAKLSTPSDAGSKFAYSEVDHNGVQDPKWSVVGVLNLDSSTDRAVIPHLREMVRTKGFKTLAGDLPDLIEGTDDNSTLNVRIQSVRISQRANSNILDYTINMFETT